MGSNFETHFFLGANSPSGFYSLYDQFVGTDTRLYIIKGGPGGGKSSFMRAIGEAASAAGKSVEYIHCSGDPDSLDGVHIPEENIAYVDGTAPHIIEPSCFGASEVYLNLGEFCDSEKLPGLREKIARITDKYKSLYKRAYRCISASHSLTDGLYTSLMTPHVKRTITKRAAGIISREIKKTGRPEGKAVFRFLGAFTCAGSVVRFDTVKTLSSKVFTMDNEYGFAPFMLSLLSSKALESGYDIILCPCPMAPDVLKHLIIPELSLAFLSVDSQTQYPIKPYKHMRLDALAPEGEVRALRPRIRASVKLSRLIAGEAVDTLREAKALHDELEAVYNPCIDFAGLTKLAARHADKVKGAG